MIRNIHLISGTSHLHLAEKIANELGVDLIKSNCRRFADGEIHCQIDENVRGKDVFVVQSIASPVNENLMELLIMVDALKRASAKSITVVAPYMAYARQDRKSGPRTPITAKLVADLLTAAGVSRVLTLDLHSEAIQGFFDIPIDNLKAQQLFVKDVRSSDCLDNSVVVSPDVGGVVRARQFAESLGVSLAIIDKRRFAPNEAVVEHVIGDVEAKECIIIDDMVDTGGTIINAAQFLVEKCKVKSVSVYSTHGVLSGDALLKLENSQLQKISFTDSLYVESSSKVSSISCAPLLAKAIECIAQEKSMNDASLFEV